MIDVPSYKIQGENLKQKIDFSANQLNKAAELLNFIDEHKSIHSANLKPWGHSAKELFYIFHTEYKDEYKRSIDDLTNYYKGLDFIADKKILTIDLIKEVHKLACPNVTLPGEFKNTANSMISQLPCRGELIDVVFVRTSPPEDVQEDLAFLVDWTNEQLKLKCHHPLFIISLFNFEFLKIHPFSDGNGRASRLLTTFLLITNGYDFVKYSSYEKIVERRRDHYLGKLVQHQVLNIPIFNVVATLLLFMEEMINEIKEAK